MLNLGYALLGFLSLLTILHLDFVTIPVGILISIFYGLFAIFSSKFRGEYLGISIIALIGVALVSSIYALIAYEVYHLYANGIDVESILRGVASHWVLHFVVNITVAIGLVWAAIAGILRRV